MRKTLLGCSFVLILTLAGCGADQPIPPTPVIRSTQIPPTATPIPDSDEAAIRSLLQAEAEGVVGQDIDRLLDIWAEDGVVTDANHTPDDPSDDLTWSGRDAIRERYVNLVFPSAPLELTPADVQLTIHGDTAVAIATTHIGREVAPGGDRWTFVKRDGRWQIASLTYNLEPE